MKRLATIAAVAVLMIGCGGQTAAPSTPAATGTPVPTGTAAPSLSAAPTIAVPTPSATPDNTAAALHIANAIDELVAGADPQTWFLTESKWLTAPEQAGLLNALPDALGYTTAIQSGLQATLDDSDFGPIIVDLQAVRSSLAEQFSAIGPAATPSPTPSEADGPIDASRGENVTITCGGNDCMRVAVLKAQFAAKYSTAYSTDRPASGNVYLAIQVHYAALSSDADYNTYDWAVYVADELIDDRAFVSGGPEPTLGSGDLATGKKVTGWIIWEVPKAGHVVVSYEPPGADGAIFEVKVR